MNAPNTFPDPVGDGGARLSFSNLPPSFTTATFGLTRGDYVFAYEALDVQNPGVVTLQGGSTATTVKFTTNTAGYVPFIIGDIEAGTNYSFNVTLGARRVSISRVTMNRGGV